MNQYKFYTLTEPVGLCGGLVNLLAATSDDGVFFSCIDFRMKDAHDACVELSMRKFHDSVNISEDGMAEYWTYEFSPHAESGEESPWQKIQKMLTDIFK